MSETIAGKIKKVQLSNGDIYSIFDEGALRLDANNVLLTGSTPVDEAILQGNLYITRLNDLPLYDEDSESSEHIDPEVVFIDPSTGELLKASLSRARLKLGIVNYRLAQTDGVLKLEEFNVLQEG